MAPIKVIQVTAQTKKQPATVAPHGANDPAAPNVAPMQASPVTGKGIQAKTEPTFAGNPALKPNPPDNGSTKIINDQRQPAPRGPAAAPASPGGQQQGS